AHTATVTPCLSPSSTTAPAWARRPAAAPAWGLRTCGGNWQHVTRVRHGSRLKHARRAVPARRFLSRFVLPPRGRIRIGASELPHERSEGDHDSLAAPWSGKNGRGRCRFHALVASASRSGDDVRTAFVRGAGHILFRRGERDARADGRGRARADGVV